MFSPRVIVIKISKKGSFFLFSADDSRKSVTVSAEDISEPGRTYWVISENSMVDRLWSYCLSDIDGRNIKKTVELTKECTKILYF